MALQPTELFGSAVSQTPNLRAYPYQDGIRPGTLAALSDDATLAHLTPLSYVESTGFYKVWSAAENATYTITADATPASDGTFTLTFLGETTAAIDHDALPAAIQAAIVALGAVNVGDVTVTETDGGLDAGGGYVTITFGGTLAGVDVSGSMATSLTGNLHVLAETVEGGGADTAEIDGFLWAPLTHAGLAAGETVIQVFRAGLVHAGDVPLPSGESQGVLDTALKSIELRKKGINIQGLAGVA